MPVFWELSRNIDRIKAENDIRFYKVVSHVVGGDTQRFIDGLVAERGEVTSTADVETGFDRRAFDRLKGMIGRGQ